MDGKREMKEWLKPEWKRMACKSFHQHETVQIVLLMECPVIPLRVAHVEYWLQFKLVSYNSLSLQTVTGIKTLGKSAVDIRNIFQTELFFFFSAAATEEPFEFELIELLFVSERERK